MDKKKKLSIVIPVYFNELNLKKLYDAIDKDVLVNIKKYDYEIVFVDDGSKDNSVMVIRELMKKDKKIKLVKLSRNFGSHNAILAGLTVSSGDVAAFI